MSDTICEAYDDATKVVCAHIADREMFVTTVFECDGANADRNSVFEFL